MGDEGTNTEGQRGGDNDETRRQAMSLARQGGGAMSIAEIGGGATMPAKRGSSAEPPAGYTS